MEKLLKACEVHFAANRLTTGSSGTAYECFREVLDLDPGNEEALAGFGEIEDRYLAWSRKSLDSGDLVRSARMLEKARKLNSEREEVLELERRLSEVGELSAVLGRPISVDATDENGWTDLHYAAALNRPELIRALLAA